MQKQKSIAIIKSDSFFDELILNEDELMILRGGLKDDELPNCGSGCGLGCGSGCGHSCSGC